MSTNTLTVAHLANKIRTNLGNLLVVLHYRDTADGEYTGIQVRFFSLSKTGRKINLIKYVIQRHYENLGYKATLNALSLDESMPIFGFVFTKEGSNEITALFQESKEEREFLIQIMAE